MLKFAEKEQVKVIGKKLAGQRVVFTGVRSPELEQYIISQGGEIVSNGSKSTICIVKSKTTGSAKMNAAESVGAKIFTLQEFIDKYQ